MRIASDIMVSIPAVRVRYINAMTDTKRIKEWFQFPQCG